jgi:ubiquinone/menaquinone biosynthesis C-methylase UbiE
MEIEEINKRYSELSDNSCCLSCGGAVNYAAVKPGEVCIDLGSGRGTDVIRMAEDAGAEGFVYGIDISDGMLEKAIKNVKKFNIKNVKFLKNELEKIELPDETADLIISNCTINHSQNKRAVWSEIYRLLKPNGRFVISDIYSTKPVPEEYRNDPVAVAECWAGAVTKEEYFEQMGFAGFGFVDVLEESKPYSKGKIEVVSFTIAGIKEQKKGCCCCG